MAKGPAVPIQGIWLMRVDDCAVVYVEQPDGTYREAIRSYIGPIEGTFSHHISEHGLESIKTRSVVTF